MNTPPPSTPLPQPPNPPEQFERFNLPKKDAVTSFQIQILLQTIGQMTTSLNMLCRTADGEKDVDGTEQIVLESSKAVSETLIRASQQIERLVLDESRWNCNIISDMEKSVLSLQAQNLEFLKAQTEATRAILRPSFRFRPTLIRMNDGSWAAALGDLSESAGDSALLVGFGNSPDSALVDFDRAFVSGASADVKSLALMREALLDLGSIEEIPPAVFDSSSKKRKKE